MKTPIIQSIAQQIHNTKYPLRISDTIKILAKEHNILIIYTSSDDCFEFRGAIEEEFDCFDGGLVYLDRQTKEIHSKPNNSQRIPIRATWFSEGRFEIQIPVPFISFNILEDNNIYCTGAILDLDSIG